MERSAVHSYNGWGSRRAVQNSITIVSASKSRLETNTPELTSISTTKATKPSTNKKGANRYQLAPFLDQKINQSLSFLRNTLHGQFDTTLRINV
jgi:hypothetical protein